MSLLNELETRCESKCELCSQTDKLSAYTVPPKTGDHTDDQVALCSTCLSQIENPDTIEVDHWRCINDSMWSTIPAVQVVAFRMLKSMPNESWTGDLLNMMYMEDSTREWAEQGQQDSSVVHKDSNGNVLQNGDSIVLIQDLKVKGASFIAKRGTAVRRISLVHDNPEHIEGRIDDQHIVLLTKFVKKT